MKGPVREALVPLGLAIVLLCADQFLHSSHLPSWMLYDALCALDERLRDPPSAIQDVVLVGIDSDTVEKMTERWPYSRATFARVIESLQQARARAIGFDFTFFGDSTPEEDAALRRALQRSGRVVLGASLTDDGRLQLSTLSDLPAMPLSGLVNKLQDADGVTRSALTYLVSGRPDGSKLRVFSWELELLEAAGDTELDALEDRGSALRLTIPAARERWDVPVDPVTKAFPIRFRAHTSDFPRLSFYDVFTGRFDPAMVADRVVLIGFLSELFQDLHRTPIGWLPGVTLNANTLLTLLARDVPRRVPRALERGAFALGITLTSLLVSQGTRLGALLWMAVSIASFLALSYGLLVCGYLWNYALFPLGAVTIASGTRWLTGRRLARRSRRRR